ncbi:hypothetical protein Tco_0942417, partial [Tanacetum coccineum]
SGADEHIELSMWLRAIIAQAQRRNYQGHTLPTELIARRVSPPLGAHYAKSERNPIHLRSSLLFGCESVSNQNNQQALALPEKEVIEPHLPVRLPYYDFTSVTSPAFGIPLPAVKVTTSGMASSHSVTGGELQPAIRTEDEFLELAHPRGIATLYPGHCSTCVAQGIRGMMT